MIKLPNIIISKINASKQKTSMVIKNAISEMKLSSEEIKIFKEVHRRSKITRFELCLSLRLKSLHVMTKNLSSLKKPFISSENMEEVFSEKVEFMIRHIKETLAYYHKEALTTSKSHDRIIRNTAVELSINLFKDGVSNIWCLPKTAFYSVNRIIKRSYF